ncbi:hypothetical protein K2X85_04740 [bacterium]|nr:hypothetical protein [bacterium]
MNSRLPTSAISTATRLAVTLAATSVLVASLGGAGWASFRASRSLPEAEGYLAQGAGEIGVLLVGSDRPMLVSAAQTIARELKSFPQDFAGASYDLDFSTLRAKGLFQLPASDVDYLARRWAELAPTLLHPDQPVSLGLLLEQGTKLLNESSDTPLDPSQKTQLLVTAHMLDSLEAFLSPGGVYRSPWTDSRTEQVMEQLQTHFQKLPTPSPGGMTLQIMLPAADDRLALARRSVRILRDVVRRVGMVFPSAELRVEGSLVRATDLLRKREQGLALLVVAGSILSGIGLAIAGRCWKSWLAGVVSSLVIAGLLAGGWTLLHGRFDLHAATSLLLAMPIALIAPTRWISLHVRWRRSEFEPTLTLRVFWSLVMRTLPGVVMAGIATGATAWLSAEPIRPTMMTATAALFTSAVVTMTIAFPMLWGWPPGVAGSSADSLYSMPRRPRLVAAVATTLVILAALGLGRWFLPSWSASIEHPPREAFASSQTPSAEQARRLSQLFREQPSVGRVVELASWIPADQLAKRTSVKTLSVLTQAWKEQPKSDLPIAPASVRQTLRQMTAPEEVAAPADEVLVDRIARLAQQVDGLLGKHSSVDQARRLSAYEKIWREDIDRQWNRVGQVCQPDPVTIADLPASLVAHFYRPDGKWNIVIYPRENRPGSLRTFRQEVLDIDPQAQGPAISFVGTIRSQSHHLLAGVVISSFIAMVTVMCVLRHSTAVIVVLSPVVAGALTSLGLLGWLGMDWNEGTLRAVSHAWPLILSFGLVAGWSSFKSTRWGANSLDAIPIVLFCWSAPLLFSPEAEFVRIGLVMLLASATTASAARWIARNWQAIFHPFEEPVLDAIDPTNENDTSDRFASTIFFKDAA